MKNSEVLNKSKAFSELVLNDKENMHAGRVNPFLHPTGVIIAYILIKLLGLFHKVWNSSIVIGMLTT